MSKKQKTDAKTRWDYWLDKEEREKTKRYIRKHNPIARGMSDRELENEICSCMSQLSDYMPITDKDREIWVKLFEGEIKKAFLLRNPTQKEKFKASHTYEPQEFGSQEIEDIVKEEFKNIKTPIIAPIAIKSKHTVEKAQKEKEKLIELNKRCSRDKKTGRFISNLDPNIYKNNDSLPKSLPKKQIYPVIPKRNRCDMEYPLITTNFQKYLSENGYIELDMDDKAKLDKVIFELCEKYTEKYATTRYNPEPEINK